MKNLLLHSLLLVASPAVFAGSLSLPELPTELNSKWSTKTSCYAQVTTSMSEGSWNVKASSGLTLSCDGDELVRVTLVPKVVPVANIMSLVQTTAIQAGFKVLNCSDGHLLENAKSHDPMETLTSINCWLVKQ